MGRRSVLPLWKRETDTAGALATGVRCAAFVGSYLSGKTTLMESLLYATGAIPRKGSVKDGNSVGDAVAEARER